MSTQLTTMTAMLLLAATCWLFRLMLIVVVPAERLPERARDALAHLAPAVLAALVAVESDAAVRGSDLATALLVVGAVVLIGTAVRITHSLGLAIALGLGAALLIDLVAIG